FHRDVRGSTTNVERTECKLCTRFTDRLCSDDSDSFTGVYHLACRQVAAVALSTATYARLASEQRTNFNFFDARLFDLLRDLVSDFRVRGTDQFIRDRIVYVVNRYTSENTLRQWLNDVFIVFQCSDLQTTQRTAVVFGDHKVLCHIHKTTGQVTCVGRLQRR